MSFRVAVAQMEIQLHQPHANLVQAEKAAREAAESRADLVVFPELMLTGPIGERLDLIDNQQQWRDSWMALASRVGVDVVAGSVIEGTPEARRNRTYYVSKDGAELGHHDKRELWRSEQPHTTPGTTVTVIERDFARIGLAVCWDLTSPSFIATLAAAGADVIAVPAYWCHQLRGSEVKYSLSAEATHIQALCVTRAFENSMAIAFANASGECVPCDPEFPKRLLGRSQVAVPFKGTLAHGGSAEELVLADIDLQLLDDARSLYGLGRGSHGGSIAAVQTAKN